MNLDGVAAIVTGAASGLGAAAAARLAQRGAKVAIFDMNAAAGEAYAHEIGGAFFQVDVSNDTSVEEAMRAAQAHHGVAREVRPKEMRRGPPGFAPPPPRWQARPWSTDGRPCGVCGL